MSQRLTTLFAWSLFAVAMGQLGLMLMVAVVDRSGPHSATVDHFAELVPLVAVVAASAAVGSVIASRRPGKPNGWLLVGGAIAIGTVFLSLVVLQSRVPAAYLGAFGVAVLSWFGSWLLVVGLILFVLTVLLFPDGVLPSRAWRWPARVSVGALGTAAIAAAFAPGPMITGESLILNPFGIPGPIGGALLAVLAAAPLLQLIGLGLVVAAPVARFRTATGDARLQLRALAFATSLVPVGLILGGTVLRETPLGFYVMMIPFALVPIAIGVAVLKYRLYDIDRVISRTISYGLITALLVMVFLLVNLGLQSLLSFVTSGNSLAVAGSTLLAAGLFTPVRRRVQRVVDRRFDRTRYDGERTASAFSARMRDAIDLPTVATDLNATVHSAVKPASLGLWIRQGRPSTLGAGSPVVTEFASRGSP